MRTEQSDSRTGIENWATNQTSSKASSDIFNDRDHPYLFKTWFGQTRPPALLPYPVIALMLAACGGGGGGGGGGSAPVTSGNNTAATSNDEVSTAEPSKTPKETVKAVVKSEVEQPGTRSNSKQAKQREEVAETPPPQSQPIEQPAREDAPAPQVPQTPPTPQTPLTPTAPTPAAPTSPTPTQPTAPPTQPTAPLSGQSPNAAPQVRGFQDSQLKLIETFGTEDPQTIEDKFFIKDDRNEIDPSQHITVERKVANDEWRVDDRFVVRPIDSTERTDDFRLRAKQGAVFDREHADDFANIQDVKSGSFRLRIKVDDGEGGITHTETGFQMKKNQ